MQPILERTATILFLSWIFGAGTFTRGDIFLENGSNYFKILEMVQLFLCSTALFILTDHKTRKIFSCILLFVALLQVHAFTFFYQPSFRLGVPIQDYRLHDLVSSNYAFSIGQKYIWNIFVALPGSLLLAERIKSNRFNSKNMLTILILSLILNAIVCFVQGKIDISFLALGSGSAIPSFRATGLVEDSGASTIYLSSMIVGLFFVFIGNPNLKTAGRASGILFTGVLFYMCSFSGGRVFFVNCILGILAGTFVLAIRKFKDFNIDNSLKILFGILTPVLMFVLSTYIAPPKIQDLAQKLKHRFLNQEESIWDYLVYAIKTADEGRLSHHISMWHDFKDNFLFGSGLGSFHANNLYYSEALHTFRLIDSPSSLYFMLLAALGISAILIFIGLFLNLWDLNFNIFKTEFEKGFSKNISLIHFAVGILFSLALSSTIGVHFNFISISSLLAPIYVAASMCLNTSRISISCYRLAFFLLSLGVCWNILTSEPAPSFRWRQRNVPQIPFGFPVPIATNELNGQWMQSGSEILSKGEKIEFFVELPPLYFPNQIELKFFDNNHQLADIKFFDLGFYDSSKPGKILGYTPPEKYSAECLSPTMDSFCYIQISNFPVWRFVDKKIGFFLINSK